MFVVSLAFSWHVCTREASRSAWESEHDPFECIRFGRAGYLSLLGRGGDWHKLALLHHGAVYGGLTGEGKIVEKCLILRYPRRSRCKKLTPVVGHVLLAPCTNIASLGGRDC